MKCPGQDRRYWREDAVYEAPCPKCGANVEFFKDESSGRCSSCGHRFSNPGADFGCAAWCSLAQECVGFTPERKSAAGPGAGALAAQLILAVKQEFAEDPARLAHAVTVYQHARDLVLKEGGDPRVVLAAALLLEMGTPGSAGQQAPNSKTFSKARRILERVGLDEPTIERVCQIIGSYQTGRELDTNEFRVVWDSDRLAKLAAENRDGDPEKQNNLIEYGWKTEAPPRQQNLQIATLMGFEAAGKQPAEQMCWLGAQPLQRVWRLPVLNDVFEIDLSERRVTTSAGRPVGPHWQILTLHYLAITSRPPRLAPGITFADLPTARSYAEVCRRRTVARLCTGVGRDGESLRAAAHALGGHPAAAGDAAFDFDVFPRLSMRLIWHAPDEEFLPSATLLLPPNVESYFAAEDIVVLSEGLVSRLGGRAF